jgi:phosphoribosylformylglycinamidine synthase
MERSFWEVEVRVLAGHVDPRAAGYRAQIAHVLGGAAAPEVVVSDLYFFAGDGATAEVVEDIARRLLADPVTQEFRVVSPSVVSPAGRAAHPGARGPAATVLARPGVMDPVEGSLLKALADLGLEGLRVRTGRRYALSAPLSGPERALIGERVLSNPVIEDVHWEEDELPSPFLRGEPYRFELVEVPLEHLSDEGLLAVSRERELSLNLLEMQAIRDHFRGLRRAPSDAELETLAQTWSEHCCHKTLTGIIEHRRGGPGGEVTEVIDNLLKTTIRRATETIAAPWCLSVFVDNAGVIAFDQDHAVTFKVETHNHPSAIEPYGGAGTGIGGVLRDTLGTGLGARPIVNTDVFCFGPPDLPDGEVPPGALHPLRVLRGVVGGVRDYGNRMGIPTASGAVFFDKRYTGNPLVFCGSVGILPRAALAKCVRPGDRIYVVGGRTGRDGIHGATFSSRELSEESETVSSGAVQIGNAITEKKLLDVLLAARDRGLYRAVTDCGAGGLSSAVGEMGETTGARVELERVPLKYEGLKYWEIWVSEAQERMVLAVPPEHGPALEALAAGEDVECTAIGEFTGSGRLELLYRGERVSDLDMAFLHGGRPRWRRRSVHAPRAAAAPEWSRPRSLGKVLRALLAAPNIASKEWIIRQYDHEVQGTSVLKPLQGAREDGPADGVAFAPLPGSRRGIVVGCGMNPAYGDLDPYRMALSAVDEAVRNVVAAGGDPAHTAILDNFSWGNTERPELLGSLVEAARGCHDAAVALGTPFISGKDSLNNEYRVGGEVVSIPPTLLVSSLSVVDDIYRLVSMDLKEVGSRLVLVGATREDLGGSHFLRHLGVEGGAVPGLDLARAGAIHRAVHAAIREGLVLACHDLSEGGLGVALAEMAFAGEVGAEVSLERVPRGAAHGGGDDDDGAAAGLARDEVLLFSESNARYLLEVRPERLEAVLAQLSGLPAALIGSTIPYQILRILGLDGVPVVAEALEDLKRSWKEPLAFDGLADG